ncbi:uracil-DNA glycosylase [Bordetella bronchialis]|nr:uracil-DNA glycosylase [Bordetella bronchialis]
MADAMTGAPRSVALNPLQRAWLREIGMEKIWLRQDGARPDAPARAAPVRAPAEAGAGAPPSVLPREKAQAGTDAGGAAGAVAGQPGEAAAARQAGHSSEAAAAPQPGHTPGPPGAAGSTTPGGPAPGAGKGSQARPQPSGPRPRPAASGARAASDEPATQAPPTAESLAMLDLPALREQVLACQACGLCRARRQAVFGMGAEQARWMVIGEAPGEQEDRQGLPFVGRSGQLLDAMLASVGMSREHNAYIANVIKCRPPGNRNPKPEEIAACRPYLMRQIALLKPERILVLGRFAAQTLLETDAAIGSLRGRVHSLKTDHGDIPMVVSYHPAYLLRSPGEKARAWEDLRLAATL